MAEWPNEREAYEKSLPYIEEAERNAKEMYEALRRDPIKIYETIPPTGLKNRFWRCVYWLIEG